MSDGHGQKIQQRARFTSVTVKRESESESVTTMLLSTKR